MLYSYKYEGTLLNEMWAYKNNKEYTYTVGIYNQGKWEKIFLQTTFIGTPKKI